MRLAPDHGDEQKPQNRLLADKKGSWLVRNRWGMRRSKVISVLSISYPITEGAKQSISGYPAIGKAFSMPDSGRSEFEIVRLLSNTHYEQINRRLEFIDKWLEISGPIGRKVIQAKHPFQFEQAAAELATFAHLHERFGTAVHALESLDKSSCPDLEVRCQNWNVRVEVYTPVDLMGFQLFERYVPMVLKYLDVSLGYDLRVTTRPHQQAHSHDQGRLYYPYTIPEEKETHKWLADFAELVREWLSNESPKQVFSMSGPGGKMEIVVEIVRLGDDRNDRQICSIWATRSTDTRLFFEVGTPEDTAESSWGNRLKRKLWKEQCGKSAEGILRMLLVNFAMADTGWPHFISEERFAVRFRDVIEKLDEGKRH